LRNQFDKPNQPDDSGSVSVRVKQMTLVEYLASGLASLSSSKADGRNSDQELQGHLALSADLVHHLAAFKAADELIFPVLDRCFGDKAGSAVRSFKGDRADWQQLWKMLLTSEVEAPFEKPSPLQVEYCQPRYQGETQGPKFILRFADSEVGDLLFEDEADAREAFSNYSISWNCYLFGTLPLNTAPSTVAVDV
jgi:hypothetical protein